MTSNKLYSAIVPTVMIAALTALVAQDTNPSSTTSTVVQLLVYGASPFLIAMIRRRKWDRDLTMLLSAAVIFLLYTAASALDGTLQWPLTGNFISGLAVAYSTQQLVYNIADSDRVGAIDAIEQKTDY